MLDEDIDMDGGTPARTQYSQQALEQSSPSPIWSPDIFKVDSAFINMKPRHRSMSKNSARKRSAGRKVASGIQRSSSRKPTTDNAKRKYLERQAITLNYRPFEFSTDDAGHYLRTQSSNSSDDKIAMIANDNNISWSDNGISRVEYEANQMAGGIENLTVECD
jgi:hypothetical protein